MLIPSDFQRVFKQGRKQRGALFTLFSCTNGKLNARLGLAIAKKHVPLAVDRNRVKRMIRESFRYHQEALKGTDIVVLMQRQVPELSKSSMQEDLNQQWQYLMRSLRGLY